MFIRVRVYVRPCELKCRIVDAVVRLIKKQYILKSNSYASTHFSAIRSLKIVSELKHDACTGNIQVDAEVDFVAITLAQLERTVAMVHTVYTEGVHVKLFGKFSAFIPAPLLYQTDDVSVGQFLPVQVIRITDETVICSVAKS
jgi:hypothetical protein